MEKLCALTDIKNFASKGFVHRGIAFFLVRRDRAVYAYRNLCPHLNIPLEWVADQFLDYDGDLIQCSTHGALFTIDTGYCVYGPCQGAALQVVSLEVREDDIWFEPDDLCAAGDRPNC